MALEKVYILLGFHTSLFTIFYIFFVNKYFNMSKLKALLKSSYHNYFFFKGQPTTEYLHRSCHVCTGHFSHVKTIYGWRVRGLSSRRQLLDRSMMDAGFYQFSEITGRSEQWSIVRATWKMKGRATNCERTNKFVSLSRAPYVRRVSKKKKKIRHRGKYGARYVVSERTRFRAH